MGTSRARRQRVWIQENLYVKPFIRMVGRRMGRWQICCISLLGMNARFLNLNRTLSAEQFKE